MERIAVESSPIKSVGYDEEQQLLEVEFKSGGIYHYEEVTPAEYAAFMSSESKGKHFGRHIKPNRVFRKLPAEETGASAATA